MSQIVWTPGVTLEQIEEQVIRQAMQHFTVQTIAAGALGISVRTLSDRLKSYSERDKKQEELDAIERRKREAHQRRARGLPELEPEQENKASSEEAKAGLRMESTLDATEEHAVSVPVGEEVQDVLPSQVTRFSSKGRR